MLTKPVYLIAAAIFAAALPGSTYSQSYPSRPIRIVVPFAPSGATDLVSRVVADRLGAALGQHIVVENRAGAEGTIALDAVAKASADGYTLVGRRIPLRSYHPFIASCRSIRRQAFRRSS